MKKPLALLMAVTFVISSFSIPAHAAVKPGAKCTTQGEKKTSQGKEFTCVKSGKKLVWNKGVVVKKPTPTPTPTPTPSPTPTPTPSPTPTPTPSSTPSSIDPRNLKLSGRALCETVIPGKASDPGPSTTQSPSGNFSSLWEKYNVTKPANGGVVNLAVKRSYAKSTEGKSRNVPLLDFYIDPELLNDVNLARQLEGINRSWQSISKLMRSDFNKPVSIVLFNDWQWLKQVHLDGGCSNESASMKASSSMAFAAGWASSDNLTAYFNYSGDNRSSLAGGDAAFLAAHELFHLIQFQNFDLTSSRQVPGWFVEGGAVAISPLVLGKDSGFLSNGNYLSFVNDPKSTLEASQAIYTFGQAGWEFLIYLIGIENHMNIWTELAKGKSFSQALLDTAKIELTDFYSMFEEIRPNLGLPADK